MKNWRFYFGIFLALAAVWIGSWLCEEVFKSPHWANFPALVSSFALFALGFAMSVISTYDETDKKGGGS